MTKLISRRNFLKGTAAGAVSIAASQLFGGASLAEDAAVYTPGTYTASEQGLESTVTVTMRPQVLAQRPRSLSQRLSSRHRARMSML